MYIGGELGKRPENALRHGISMLAQEQRLVTIKTRRYSGVPDNVLIVSYRIGGARDSLFFVETIKNRNHQVLNLTQGYF
jgi:hypothetical protein